MNPETYIKKYKELKNSRIINKYENNISVFLLSFILNKDSKILQIGNIDKISEKIIKDNINNNYYVKMNDINFNFNKLQNKLGFHFNTIIFAFYKKTYEFCINYSAVFKQIDYLFFYYNDKTKLCNSVRSPFSKRNFNSLLYFPFIHNIENKGATFRNQKIEYEIFKKGDLKGEIGKFKFSYGKDKLNITSIINHLIYKFNYNDYFEIGVGDGSNFNLIKIKNKFGIDPEPYKESKSKNVYLMTSDEYFDYIIQPNQKFDLIFIDGSNLENQVTKDINNSIKHLNKDGCIIIKNCNPTNKVYQRENFYNNGQYLPWNGTTWKSYAKLRMNNPNLSMRVINCEWGIGIIKFGRQKCYSKIDNLKYNHLDMDRCNLLNLISVYEFLSIY